MTSQTIPLARFLVLICQRAGQVDDVTYRDPFGAARNFISASPDNAEAKMLSRLWDAIYLREGEFKESEIYLLGPQALVIAAALAETPEKDEQIVCILPADATPHNSDELALEGLIALQEEGKMTQAELDEILDMEDGRYRRIADQLKAKKSQ